MTWQAAFKKIFSFSFLVTNYVVSRHYFTKRYFYMIYAELFRTAETQNSPFGVEVNYIEAVPKNTDTDTYRPIGKKFKKGAFGLDLFQKAMLFRARREEFQT